MGGQYRYPLAGLDCGRPFPHRVRDAEREAFADAGGNRRVRKIEGQLFQLVRLEAHTNVS